MGVILKRTPILAHTRDYYLDGKRFFSVFAYIVHD